MFLLANKLFHPHALADSTYPLGRGGFKKTPSWKTSEYNLFISLPAQIKTFAPTEDTEKAEDAPRTVSTERGKRRTRDAHLHLQGELWMTRRF